MSGAVNIYEDVFDHVWRRELATRARASAQADVNAIELRQHELIALESRHLVLSPDPESTHPLYPYQVAWTRLIENAFATGIGDADLRGRLRSLDGVDFRSALAECTAAWFFEHQLGMKVRGRAPGKGRRNVDMLVVDPHGVHIAVEVKAPVVERVSKMHHGNDSGVLRTAISDAGRQFADDRPGIVAVVPVLRDPVYLNRAQLTQAAIGDQVWVADVLDDEGTLSEVRPEFRQSGKLARLHRHPDGETLISHATRVSAVLCIESTWVRGSEPGSGAVGYVGTALLNPWAKHPVSGHAFEGCPAFVREGSRMEWSRTAHTPRTPV